MQAREWSLLVLGSVCMLLATTCGVDSGGRSDDVADATPSTPLGLSSRLIALDANEANTTRCAVVSQFAVWRA